MMRTLRIYSLNFAVYDTAVLPIVIVLYITSFIVAVCVLSRVGLFATPQTVAHQAPLSMGFPRQEYWSGLPFPPPGDSPDPGNGPTSLVSPALAAVFFTTVPPGKSHVTSLVLIYFINGSLCLSTTLQDSPLPLLSTSGNH